jgi:glucokinase
MSACTETLSLGIDLGGSKILTAVVDSGGTIRAHDHRATPADQGKAAVLQAIFRSADHTMAQVGLAGSTLAAVGVGVPGPSNPQTGILFSSPNLPGWKDVPIRDIIAEKIGLRAFLINDANAAALAEFRYGAGRGACCLAYITVSTGIGGGFIIDGKVFSGARGMAAEIGHMTIEADNGPPCNCGNVGCWEALASGTALAEEARRRLSQGAQSAILTYADGDPNRVTAQVVQRAAQAGDPLADQLLRRTSHYLGTGFANLINVINPDVMVIGGGLAKIGDPLLKPAYAVAKTRAFASAYAAVRFAPAELEGNSGVIGAAAHALQEVGGL